MEYRKMEKLNIETSLLGFGCMRFPTTGSGKISRARSEKMIDAAMQAGVNYYDTAYPYHDGESESFMGDVLQKYERGTYYLATKLPCWEVQSMEDAERIFNEQFEKLKTDYIDFYLLHALNAERFHKMCELGVINWLEEQQKAGRIKYYGFSFHDSYEVFEEIIRYRAWDFCQIQLNYMDTEEQAGIKGYKLAEELGIPMIVMEPVRGGSLAYMEDSIGAHFKELSKNATYASWALRWVGSLPNVKVILSGMSSMEQVHDNLYTFSPFMPLTPNEQIAVLKVSTERRKRIKNGCTGCGYCMPCPKGVNIPENFRIWNDYGIYENVGALKWSWSNDIAETEKPKNCVECGLCEKACPQKLPIRENLKQLQTELDLAVAETLTEI
ncbi:MAG: aldo/keto reductase [bacterium]|nr:aldo/keto reductase [bacterium]